MSRGKKLSTPMPEETAPEWMKRAAARIEAAEKAEQEAQQRAAERRKTGRPSLYDPVYCDDVVAWGNLGWEIVEMAAAIGVRRQTLYDWAEKEPAFSDALARAREAAEAFHANRIRQQSALPAKETNLSAYLSYMGRRFKEWRERQEIEHNVNDTLARRLEEARKRGRGSEE